MGYFSKGGKRGAMQILGTLRTLSTLGALCTLPRLRVLRILESTLYTKKQNCVCFFV